MALKKSFGTTQFQVGKNGLTEGVLTSLALALKHHDQIRISILKSSGRTRDSMKDIAAKIEQGMHTPATAHIIGFTIIVKKGRSKKKQAKPL